MVLTLSQVQAWRTEHLIEAATYWSKTADQWEDVFLQMRNQSHTLVWEGAGGDALRQRTGADLAIVSTKPTNYAKPAKSPAMAPEPSALPNAGCSMPLKTPTTPVSLSEKTSQSPISEPAAGPPSKQPAKHKHKHKHKLPTSANAQSSRCRLLPRDGCRP